MCLCVSREWYTYLRSLEGANYNAYIHKENVKCAVIAYRNENYTVELHLIILLAKEWPALHLHYVYAVADIVISGVLIWYFNFHWFEYMISISRRTQNIWENIFFIFFFWFIPFVWIAIFVSNRSSAINIPEVGWKTCLIDLYFIVRSFEIWESNLVLFSWKD